MERLKKERLQHLCELERIGAEKSSKIKEGDPRVGSTKRYLLLSLLGKGGFAEVWKAYDFRENRFVAIKFQTTEGLDAQDKSTIQTSLNREINILKNVKHPRIVEIYDTFVMPTSHGTVLELCDGDLRSRLRLVETLEENDARSIIVQVVSALVHLNTSVGAGSVIHYDLKPDNILMLNDGDVKITDFGLSKIARDDPSGKKVSIPLSRQGAGTWHYLPPECFFLDQPQISSKVDVWSVGVILFECLYGTLPFGLRDNYSHVEFRNNVVHIMTNETTRLTFPEEPKLSEAARAFISKCLTHAKAERPDVVALLKDDFLLPPSRNRASAPTCTT